MDRECSIVWRITVIRSTFAKRLLPRLAVPAERCVTRVTMVSIDCYAEGWMCHRHRKPENDRRIQPLRDTTPLQSFRWSYIFYLFIYFLTSYKSLSYKLQELYLSYEFSNKQETLRKENEASRIEKCLRSGAVSLFFWHVEDTWLYTNVWGRGAKVVTVDNKRYERIVKPGVSGKIRGFVGWGMIIFHNFCISVLFSAGYVSVFFPSK